jgi:hypothetical protein
MPDRRMFIAQKIRYYLSEVRTVDRCWHAGCHGDVVGIGFFDFYGYFPDVRRLCKRHSEGAICY